MDTFPRQVWEELETEFDLSDHYSGRGMCGARCISLTGRLSDLLRFIAASIRRADALGVDGEDLTDTLAAAVRSDHLGLEQIFYFPDITLDTER